MDVTRSEDWWLAIQGIGFVERIIEEHSIW
jgi:hypothetical protein